MTCSITEICYGEPTTGHRSLEDEHRLLYRFRLSEEKRRCRHGHRSQAKLFGPSHVSYNIADQMNWRSLYRSAIVLLPSFWYLEQMALDMNR
jgi:hypothetical protein